MIIRYVTEASFLRLRDRLRKLEVLIAKSGRRQNSGWNGHSQVRDYVVGKVLEDIEPAEINGDCITPEIGEVVIYMRMDSGGEIIYCAEDSAGKCVFEIENWDCWPIKKGTTVQLHGIFNGGNRLRILSEKPGPFGGTANGTITHGGTGTVTGDDGNTYTVTHDLLTSPGDVTGKVIFDFFTDSCKFKITGADCTED